MYVLIAGGGKVGSNLARTLIRAGHEVTLIEQRDSRFEVLEAELEHQVHKGDATELFTLERAGIEDADAVVVTTDGDNSNIVIGQMAQKQFAVPSVVVRVLDPARAEFYSSRGLNVVCPTSSAISTLTDAVRAAEGAIR